MESFKESSAELVGAEVLNFYRELPFNFGSDIAFQSRGVLDTDPTALHPPLRKIVDGAKVLEVGSGAGWFSNGLAFHHSAQCLGIDFNQIAVDRANECAKALNLTTKFEVADLFTFSPQERFPLVVSLGVLHHTGNLHLAIRRVVEFFMDTYGFLYLGLYHLYGRRPFLEHFANLRESGSTVESLEAEFLRLYGHSNDSVHLKSWFRDQVLHPHETQHTYSEIRLLLESLGLEVLATSLNRFRKIKSHKKIERDEVECEHTSRLALQAGRYYPGYFTVLAQKT